MKRLTVLLALILVLGSHALFAETAVLPYRAGNPSEKLTAETARDFARLVALTALLSRDVRVTSSRDIELDMERLKIDPAKKLSSDDLQALTAGKYIDTVLAGTLYKTRGGYESVSVLYSVPEKRVLSRISSAGSDIFELAENEVREAFTAYPAVKRGYDAGSADVAFLLDLSWNISCEWGDVRAAVIASASDLIDARRMDCRVTLIPFSGKNINITGVKTYTTLHALRQALAGMKPSGKPDASSFVSALRYAVGNVRWRKGSAKHIVLITNSEMPSARFPEQEAARAAGKGIALRAVSLGSLTGSRAEIPERVAASARGKNIYAVYSQKAFTETGSPVYLYFQNGRAFRSERPASSWRGGVYVPDRYNPSMGKALEPLSEMRSEAAGPYSLPELFEKQTGRRVIKKGPLLTNLKEIVTGAFGQAGRGQAAAGSALLTDGRVSFRVMIPTPKMLSSLRAREGAYIYAGFYFRDDPAGMYGIAPVPVIVDVPAADIPGIIKTDFTRAVKKRSYYMSHGAGKPPVWFVKVRVDQVEGAGGEADIRD